MKVLHLLASPYWTGPAENVAWLALAQREQGHEVSVAIDCKRRTAPAEELAAPRLQALGLLDERGLELSVKSSPLAMLADVRRLARIEVDVVHAHFSHDHFLARWGGREGQGARALGARGPVAPPLSAPGRWLHRVLLRRAREPRRPARGGAPSAARSRLRPRAGPGALCAPSSGSPARR